MDLERNIAGVNQSLRHPILVEINTRCRLHELSLADGRPVSFSRFPESELDAWTHLGATHIWMMGVWTTGSRPRKLALENNALRETYFKLIPDWSPKDVCGSPYAISRYEVSKGIGGPDGLKQFRERLNARGQKLVLDFVPNHLACDHPWITEHPDFFVHAPRKQPEHFRATTREGPRWFAHGKDPWFPAWSDTVQLDYRKPQTRAAMIETLLGIAAQCDGVRCDMAMLLLNSVFHKTWSRKDQQAAAAGAAAETEFCHDAIRIVRKEHPGFLFLAEAYWGLESTLLELGFDYAYDKTFRDLLFARRGFEMQTHLQNQGESGLSKMAHFLENHDEERVASALSVEEHRAALFLTMTLPGMRFLHDGEWNGARLKTPVQLARRQNEPVDVAVAGLYSEVFQAVKSSNVGRTDWALLTPREAWSGNHSHASFIVIQWGRGCDSFDLAVVNLANHTGQCSVDLLLPDATGGSWDLVGRMSLEKHVREDARLRASGLFLELPAHGVQLFRVSRVSGV